jgi:hypothetical protein
VSVKGADEKIYLAMMQYKDVSAGEHRFGGID